MTYNVAVPRPALDWVVSGDTGLSSKSIWAHMLGLVAERFNHPHDPADLGRCLRLLEAVPHWKPRIAEMAAYSNQWAALTARWDEIATSMADEVGIDWSKGMRAPKTYALMDSILYPSTPEGVAE